MRSNSVFGLMFLQVGLPNVGKSTFFNIVTKLAIPAENFPFCTIEPNEARVNVPDERFDWLCKLYKPKSEVCFFSLPIFGDREEGGGGRTPLSPYSFY